ncbi:MAG TPA: alpha/beta hydrolase [Rectinemataceae bacterium]|nr:alpha/beta hydrolase [Rectinemataceae bacterium]
MRIEPRIIGRRDFPSSLVSAEGIGTIFADESRRAVNVTFGVEYSVKSGMPLHLTILEPRLEDGEEAAFPLVVFVQGSAWFKQELHQNLGQLVPYAASGLVIAMVEYRPSPLAPFPAQVKDARTATGFMLANAARYHIDPNRLILWGDSSGGHTVAMIAATEGLEEFADEAAGPLPIRGVVDYYGPNLLATMNEEPSIQDHDAPNSPEGMLLGGVRVSEHPERVAKASPLSYIESSRPLPPFLIMHGDKDRLVPFGQSVLLFKKLKDCGHRVEMYRLVDADHGGRAFWTSKEACEATRDFLRRCLA